MRLFHFLIADEQTYPDFRIKVNCSAHRPIVCTLGCLLQDFCWNSRLAHGNICQITNKDRTHMNEKMGTVKDVCKRKVKLSKNRSAVLKKMDPCKSPIAVVATLCVMPLKHEELDNSIVSKKRPGCATDKWQSWPEFHDLVPEYKPEIKSFPFVYERIHIHHGGAI